MSILGNRVLRREDPKFLTEGGTYVEDVRDERLRGADGRPRPDPLDRHLGGDRRPGRDRRLHGRGRRAAGAAWTVPPQPGREAATAGLGGGALRRRAGSRCRHRDAPAGGGRRRAGLRGLPAPASGDRRRRRTSRARHPPREEAGTNVVLELADGPLDENLFDGCEVVVSERIRNQRVAIAPLEVRGRAAASDGDRLTIWLSSQVPHLARDAFQEQLGLEPGSVRVIAPRRGRRLRREDGVDARRGPHGMAGPPPRSADALDRDPHREHAGHGPRPGPASDRHDRGLARRKGPGLAARDRR